jgi:hypothetical protein
VRQQSKSLSWLEASTNVTLGFVLALVIQALVYPLFGIATTLTTKRGGRSDLHRCVIGAVVPRTARVRGSWSVSPV